jgi:toxin ParE1/3/4
MSIVIRPRAAIDLDDIAEYLERNRAGYGQRFLQAASTTFALLEQLPEAGAVFAAGDPALIGMRHFPVRGFKYYQVFYLPVSGGIDVVRVLHGARNLGAILGGDGA